MTAKLAFTVLIPARLASSRLPNKPLADIGGLPMVVRVAQQALKSGAVRCAVAADDPSIVAACETHGIEALLTGTHHLSGSDRLAEACAEWLHQQVRTNYWGYAKDEHLDNEALIKEQYQGIRPAPGYPANPDHTQKDTIWDLLKPEENAGISMTES